MEMFPMQRPEHFVVSLLYFWVIQPPWPAIFLKTWVNSGKASLCSDVTRSLDHNTVSGACIAECLSRLSDLVSYFIPIQSFSFHYTFFCSVSSVYFVQLWTSTACADVWRSGRVIPRTESQCGWKTSRGVHNSSSWWPVNGLVTIALHGSG